MQPKRFICCIYHVTQTILNIEATDEFVLQLLAVTQYRLIDLLGKKSGKNIDKISRQQKINELMEWFLHIKKLVGCYGAKSNQQF